MVAFDSRSLSAYVALERWINQSDRDPAGVPWFPDDKATIASAQVALDERLWQGVYNRFRYAQQRSRWAELYLEEIVAYPKPARQLTTQLFDYSHLATRVLEDVMP